MVPFAPVFVCAWSAFVQLPTPTDALAFVEKTNQIASLALDGGFLEIEAGDVNGDGHPDLVSVGDHGSPFVNTQQHGITLWLGDGAGGWTLVQTGDFGYGGIALGDANSDGRMDVAYGVHHDYSGVDFGDQLIECALGDGTGFAWTPWDDGLATSGETYGMFGTDFGDVDADGDLDLGSSSFGCCAGVHVYRNAVNGTWTQSFGFLGGNSDGRFEFADFDGDGNLDVAAAVSPGVVYLGDGAGGFVLADGNLPASHYVNACAGDVDANGRDELGFVSGGQARIFAWGAGDVWTDLTANLAMAAGIAVQELAFADLDVDGDDEVLVFANGVLAVCARDASGVWSKLGGANTAGAGSKPGVLLRGGVDLDHNGFPDVWLVQEEPRGIFGAANVHRVLAEASVPTNLNIRPLAPQPNHVWRGGQVRFVDWTSAVPAGVALGKVMILLSTNDGAGPYTLLASGRPNDGRAQIVVPSGVNSNLCRLIYVVTSQPTGRKRATGPRFTILP